MKIKVGSRGSALALAQTEWVIGRMKEKNPAAQFEIKIIKTKGDRILDIALDKIGDKGLFVKEIEKELLSGDIDMAVHSMKDMPSETPQGLLICKSPLREDPRDALVLREGLSDIGGLPEGALIGTGSKRRESQIASIRPDINTAGIRGNIVTRLEKLREQNLDGIMLAAAGLKRLGLEGRISQYMSLESFLPAPAQGTLAIEIRSDDKRLIELADSISDTETCIQTAAERAFLAASGGGCHMPIGAYCSIDGERLRLDGLLGTEDGSKTVRMRVEGIRGEEAELGRKLAEMMLKELSQYEG